MNKIVNSTIEPPQWHVLKVNIDHAQSRLDNEYMKPSRLQDVITMRYLTAHIRSMKEALIWINHNVGIFN